MAGADMSPQMTTIQPPQADVRICAKPQLSLNTAHWSIAKPYIRVLFFIYIALFCFVSRVT